MNKKSTRKLGWRIWVSFEFNFIFNFIFIHIFTLINKKTWISANQEALKGFLKGIILANLAHLSGIFVFVTYAGLVFKMADTPNIDPYYSSIAIAVMQIVGNLCTGQLSDTLGRKILLYISFLGSACGLLSFALYSYLHQNGYALSNFQWVPVISLSLVIFTASAGIVPLASVLIVENLPSKVNMDLYRFKPR